MLGPLFCVTCYVSAEGAGTQVLAKRKIFHQNFPPQMCSQNDQRNPGIILSHTFWGRPPPPPLRTAGRAPPAPPTLRHGGQGGGGWEMGLRAPLPPHPLEQFSSRHRCIAACSWWRLWASRHLPLPFPWTCSLRPLSAHPSPCLAYPCPPTHPSCPLVGCADRGRGGVWGAVPCGVGNVVFQVGRQMYHRKFRGCGRSWGSSGDTSVDSPTCLGGGGVFCQISHSPTDHGQIDWAPKPPCPPPDGRWLPLIFEPNPPEV